MKKIIIYFSLMLFLLLNIQCKKSAIEKPVYGTQSNATFYKTDAQIQQALTGVYLQLRVTWNEYAKYHYFVGDVSTDDAWKAGSSDGDYGEAQDMSNFILTPTNGLVAQRWGILYNLIARANEVIAYAPDASGDKTLINRYINEAKVLRAFGYYSLVTTEGGVPLVTKPITPAEATSTPRATADAVFKQIETDLTEASNALPAYTAYGDADKNRVSRGTALAILGKAYMFQLNYVKAEETFRQLVKSNDYALLNDYGANWRDNFNTESIFVIDSRMQDKDVAIGSNIPHFFTTRNTPGYQGYGFHAPTKDLRDEFAADDPRITYTFTMTGDRYLQDNNDQDNAGSPDGYYDRKIEVPQYLRLGYNPWIISYNVRLIRYSDALLMFAEALNENGKADEALTYLNMIRKRARETPPKDPQRQKQVYIPATTAASLPDVTTTDQTELRKAIWHERRCELGMEGWRREDLVRQKRFGEIMRAFAAKYNTNKGKLFRDDRDYLFPIPQNEIDYSNRTITQNPNY
ncbi:MAG: RagB/SusD family nutrient uptake outer membrane protein [Bacteroidota bacterium]